MDTPKLNTADLQIYLNDHLAGATAAIELIEHLSSSFPRTPLQTFFDDLLAEVSADRDVLRELLQSFGEEESTVRKASAWIGEKLARVKLSLTGDEKSGSGFLEAMDALIIGITGKLLLWRALDAASETVPALKRLDYAQLQQRAITQRDRVEEKHLDAARAAFVLRHEA